ncbi:uncharacterized protein LOC123530375 [Mercenaria mercenaria]|uniref:uncharacterized protein LOC123530375 n=1 Tax=Mercenaria mercenaria TaxID=6596 RepID=UPI00234E5FD2|nr:uncharacterized protein LOC123530375 [Mercenaria mercenaria]
MENCLIILFKGLFFLQVLQSLAASGHVNIQVLVLQYDNPLGTSFHGSDFTSQRKCCDKDQVTACSTTDMCDSYFVICIGGIATSGHNSHCSGPKVTTKVFRNANLFGASHDNILIQSFKWDNWHSGGIEYLANVMDQDSGNDELIENLTSTRALTVGSSYENSTEHVISFTNFVSLDLGVRIWCQDGYFGSNCSNKCTSNPYSVCINNQATLLPSCNDADVSRFEFTGILNYKATNLQLLLIKFVLQEICPKAQNAHVQVVHFSLSGVVEFKAMCDNATISSLTFSTHLYILSLTNKPALSHYFPGIPLKTSSVTQKNIRGAHTFMMLRALSYHDSSSACKSQSCKIQITVCIHPQNR